MLFGHLLVCISAFISLAGASRQQVPLSQQDQHQAPANRTISPQLFADLEELSRIVDISYCVGDLGLGIQKPFSCASRCKDFEHFELVKTWNTGPLLSDSCGYIALSHAPAAPRVILAFRGTYSISNTIADLTTVPQEYVPYPGGDDPNAPKCNNCTVHMGFYTSWRHTRDAILPDVQAALAAHPNYALVLVGHSLGGAVAALAGLELQAQGHSPTVTTFGEPRVGNGALAAYLDAVFDTDSSSSSAAPRYRRVTHADDPIPHLPPAELGFAAHGAELFVAKKDLPPARADVVRCVGAADPACSGRGAWWTRFKLWQLFFAHRDYFWRLGLCIPAITPGDEWDGWSEVELRV